MHLKWLGFMIQKKTNMFSLPRLEETEHKPVTTETLQTLGKKRLAAGDEVHIELPAKCFQASHNEGKTSFVLVDANSQPRQ